MGAATDLAPKEGGRDPALESLLQALFLSWSPSMGPASEQQGSVADGRVGCVE